MLEAMCKSTGLRRAALIHDMVSAHMRIMVSGDERELDALTDEQVALWLVAIKAAPGDAAWQYGERRLGTLTP